MYILDVGENDFHVLKRDQALLVEFAVFPSKLIELMQLCLSNQSSELNLHSEDMDPDGAALGPTRRHRHDSTAISSFMAKLDTGNGNFSIVESNNFKLLTHICLQLRPGNDAAIKNYLASRLFTFCSLSQRLGRDLEHTKATLAEEQESHRVLIMELQEMRCACRCLCQRTHFVPLRLL